MGNVTLTCDLCEGDYLDGHGCPTCEESELRRVDLDGYTLAIYDAGRRDELGKHVLRYRFEDPQGDVLFQGEDFACPLGSATDSDETLRSLITFLTLQPGDTDPDYFRDYTANQMAFALGEAEQLSIFGLRDGPELIDLGGAA